MWTVRAILGLVGIIIAWCLGWFVILFSLWAIDYKWDGSIPKTPWMKFVGVAPFITYLFAGPAACFMYIRWIRKKAGQEHEYRTRQNIAQLKRDRNRAGPQ